MTHCDEGQHHPARPAGTWLVHCTFQGAYRKTLREWCEHGIDLEVIIHTQSAYSWLLGLVMKRAYSLTKCSDIIKRIYYSYILVDDRVQSPVINTRPVALRWRQLGWPREKEKPESLLLLHLSDRITIHKGALSHWLLIRVWSPASTLCSTKFACSSWQMHSSCYWQAIQLPKLLECFIKL